MARAREVLSRHADELRTRFGLKQVSVGLLKKGDIVTNDIGIVCFVTPDERDTRLEQLPESIEGVPVQIIRMREGFSPRPANARHE